MKEPKISVIVPVYNVEQYLGKCLDSILCQTFSNIEIICVNDGSTDSSRKILEEYKNKDSRIIIVDKKNGGLSSARNAGMKVAKGEFYSFIDSDDWIDKTMLEKLYENITLYNSDIVFCGVHLFDENKQEIDDSNEYYNLSYLDKTFENRNFCYKDVKKLFVNVGVMAWNKLYRRSLVEKYNAQFPDGKIFEDGPFFYSVYYKTDKISMVRDALYFYRVNRKSSIIQKGGRKFLDIVDVIELMYNSIKDLPDYEEIKYQFFRDKVDDILSRYESLSFKYKILMANKVKRESSLISDELFSPSMVKGRFKYNYYLYWNKLKKGNVLGYEIQRWKCRLMFKIIEILCTSTDYYYIKYKNFSCKVKKHPKLFIVYYYLDRIYVVLLEKIRFNFSFKFSILEKLKADE